jgi:hypothetical protein
MARQLRSLILELGVTPEAYAALEGEGAAMTRTDGVDWSILGPTWRRGDALGGSAYTRELTGELFAAAAVLELEAGAYTTDATWDLAAAGARTARTPTMTAEGLRSWDALELLITEPEDADGATYVLFRLWDGSQALWWDGADWTTPVDALADWNTAADLQANFPELPASIRSLAVIAFLGTTDPDYSPGFYGARVAYGVRQVSPLDDALFRTLLAELRASLSVVGVLELTATAATAATITLTGSEWGYAITGVDAVFDLTDDPQELEEVPGSYAAGAWTPTAPLTVGHVYRLEFRYVPDLVVRRNRDLEQVARLPAVYIAPSGTSDQVLGQADALVADVITDPPTALVLPPTALVTSGLEIRVIGELGSDVERIAAALGDFLGSSGYRALVSPETGQPITVRQLQEPVESTGTLAVGVCEARATWSLTYPRQARQAATPVPLVRSGGYVPSTFTE